MPIISLTILIVLVCSSLCENCTSDNGIFCDCVLQDSGIQILNCIRFGGWSSWNKWSKCREGTRKRRRICNNPLPIGTVCIGGNVEKQECAQANDIPEYVFGSWTSWNPWSRCDCDRNLKMRTRYCKANSCEGCNNEHQACFPGECSTSKKWTNWSDWSNYGMEQVRYSAWCSAPNSFNVDVGLQKETRESDKLINWSDWHMYPGVTYRYRVLQNSTLLIEHHLISRSTTSCLQLYFAIPIFCFCILIGFLLQNLILCVVSRCQKRFTKNSSLYQSNNRDYPSHLIRPTTDECYW